MVKRVENSLHQIFTEESLLTRFYLGPTFLGESNFFNNRATNASKECFNAKLKQFRVDLRGVNDVPFFLCRVANIYAK
ncbi:MAG: hypothetical protein ACRCY5_07680 [Phocaeicola sp.]